MKSNGNTHDPSGSVIGASEEPEEFWRFSCACYARGNVEQHCLLLQEECGASVNIILLCFWLAERGVALQRDDFAVLRRRIERWENDCVKPIRLLRKRLKHGAGASDTPSSPEGLVGCLKRAELEAERVTQGLLLSTDVVGKAAEYGDPREAARYSLHEYGQLQCGGQCTCWARETAALVAELR